MVNHKTQELETYKKRATKFWEELADLLITRLIPALYEWNIERDPEVTVVIIKTAEKLERLIKRYMKLGVPSDFEDLEEKIIKELTKLRASQALLKRGFSKNNDKIIEQGFSLMREARNNLKSPLLELYDRIDNLLKKKH